MSYLELGGRTGNKEIGFAARKTTCFFSCLLVVDSPSRRIKKMSNLDGDRGIRERYLTMMAPGIPFSLGVPQKKSEGKKESSSFPFFLLVFSCYFSCLFPSLIALPCALRLCLSSFLSSQLSFSTSEAVINLKRYQKRPSCKPKPRPSSSKGRRINKKQKRQLPRKDSHYG